MDPNDRKLTKQGEEWVRKAMKNSTRKSKKLVSAEAHSMSKSIDNRKRFQYARWDGYRILNFSARMCHRFLFDLLQELSVDPNLLDRFDGTTPLHHAAASGQNEMIESLVNRYVCNIEAADKHGHSTPLCLATMFGHNASVEMLLGYGASTEVVCFLGMPLHIATHKGNISAVRALHLKNPDVVDSKVFGFCTPLVCAVFYDSTDCFKYLAEIVDVTAEPLMYKVICHLASEDSSLERVNILLNRGVKPNSSYDMALFEEMPIFCAARRGWKTVVSALLGSTDVIPGIEWSAEGIMRYVNSEDFEQNYRGRRESKVYHLKEKLLKELAAWNYLAADLICKILYLDMEREEWDYYQSLCKFLIKFGMKSLFPTCAAPAIHYLAMSNLVPESEADYETALLGAKACLAFEPDNAIYRGFLLSVELKLRSSKEPMEKAGRT